MNARMVPTRARPVAAQSGSGREPGPTQTATAQDRWDARLGPARLVAATIIVVPLLASTSAALASARLLPRPPGPGVVPWWLAIVVAAHLALRVAERGVRRFIPLAGLLRVSLVFPDKAPSRFAVALRAGNTAGLDKAVRAAVRDGLPPDLDEAVPLALAMITALGRHDRGTRGHSERVRAYAEVLGAELGLAQGERDRLRWGALLHDMGKLAVPAAILNKAGRPDPDEWAILQTHPAAGERMLEPLRHWLGDAFHAAGHHHERWDGTGYPRGLAGTDIALSGRIVAVADAFAVMTTARAYKKPFPLEVARRELAKGVGTQFDPSVVRALLGLSIGRLSGVAGPAAALSNLPAIGSLVASSTAPAIVSGALAAAAAFGVATNSATVPPARTFVAAEPTVSARRIGQALGGGSRTLPGGLALTLPASEPGDRDTLAFDAPQPYGDAGAADAPPGGNTGDPRRGVASPSGASEVAFLLVTPGTVTPGTVTPGPIAGPISTTSVPALAPATIPLPSNATTTGAPSTAPAGSASTSTAKPPSTVSTTIGPPLPSEPTTVPGLPGVPPAVTIPPIVPTPSTLPAIAVTVPITLPPSSPITLPMAVPASVVVTLPAVTLPPVTVAPTTLPPVTVAPTTLPPVTVAPITLPRLGG